MIFFIIKVSISFYFLSAFLIKNGRPLILVSRMAKMAAATPNKTLKNGGAASAMRMSRVDNA